MTILKHEVWTDVDGLTGVCLSGPMGDGFRALQGDGARLTAVFEASSHFEAMTKYYSMIGLGDYTTEFDADRQPYPADWQDVQSRT